MRKMKDKIGYNWRTELANILVASWVFATIIIVSTLLVVSNSISEISFKQGLDIYMTLLPIFLIISLIYKFGSLEYVENKRNDEITEKRSAAGKKAANTRKRNAAKKTTSKRK